MDLPISTALSILSSKIVWTTNPNLISLGSLPASRAPENICSIDDFIFSRCIPTRIKTPSATRPAARKVLGPAAAIHTGTGR